MFATWVSIWAGTFISSDGVDTDVRASSVVGCTFVDVDAFFTNSIPCCGVAFWDVCAYDLSGSVDWSKSGWADNIAHISWTDTRARKSCSGGGRDGLDGWAGNIYNTAITITFGVAESTVATTSAHG